MYASSLTHCSRPAPHTKYKQEGAISSGYIQAKNIFERMYNINVGGNYYKQKEEKEQKEQQKQKKQNEQMNEFKYTSLKTMIKRGFYVSCFVAATTYFVYRYVDKNKIKKAFNK